MNFLLITVGLVLMNFAVPYGAWGYGAHYLNLTEREFLKRYGLISLPRALSAALVILTMSAGWALPGDQDWLYLAAILFSALFGASAGYDVWKATKGSWVKDRKIDRTVA
jgi:hypothetical protein